MSESRRLLTGNTRGGADAQPREGIRTTGYRYFRNFTGFLET